MERKGNHELRIAEQIVSVLPEGSYVRVCSDEREAIRYAVRSSGLRIKNVILGRASLKRLISDPAGAVKIEYLQRELLDAAAHRSEFRFPRVVRRASAPARPQAPTIAPRASAS